jgi:hypothetical protein
MPSSWQVRAAALLVALHAAVGVAVVLLAFRLLNDDPGFLFAILPIVAMGLAAAGLFLTAAALTLASRLMTCRPGARLQTVTLGAFLAASGLWVLVTSTPLVGLLVMLEGGVLGWLMLTPAAKADLDGLLEGFKQPAAWGSTPGTAIWSKAPAQHGPWSPDPTTVPWVSGKSHSGPRTPWWVTWEAGLKHGIPVWEALLLGVALLGFVAGLVLVLVGMGQHHRMGSLASAFTLGSIGLTWFLERRMRARLAGRR